MTIADTKKRLAETTQQIYTSHQERSAMRCALGDAAALCDSLAKEIANQHRGRRGKGPVTKLGRQLEEIAKLCGNQIWAMRELVQHDTPK